MNVERSGNAPATLILDPRYQHILPPVHNSEIINPVNLFYPEKKEKELIICNPGILMAHLLTLSLFSKYLTYKNISFHNVWWGE